MKNADLYGYDIKPFILSLIEIAIEISNGTVNNQIIQKLLDMGKKMLLEPVELLNGIEDTLSVLSKKYRLVTVTKGNLLDQ